MKIAFFDTKTYDRKWFDRLREEYSAEIVYYEGRLNSRTAVLAAGCDVVCPFVNDQLDRATIDALYDLGIRLIALRCAVMPPSAVWRKGGRNSLYLTSRISVGSSKTGTVGSEASNSATDASPERSCLSKVMRTFCTG